MSDDRKRGIDLRDAVAFAAEQKGLHIEALFPGDTVTVVTQHTRYALRVVDPGHRKVCVVKGNPEFFPNATESFVNGSSMTGTGAMVRVGWIGVGFRLWLGHVLLSETKEILVNDEPYQTTDDDDGPAVAH